VVVVVVVRLVVVVVVVGRVVVVARVVTGKFQMLSFGFDDGGAEGLGGPEEPFHVVFVINFAFYFPRAEKGWSEGRREKQD
jgi:hypothetical protein